jgi:acylphosphatase
MICKRVYYSGRVQGVGFRYTASHLASGFAVAGFVRNLPNGDVELLAEGEADQVEALLKAVADFMWGNISRVTVHDEPPGGRQGFTIVR